MLPLTAAALLERGLDDLVFILDSKTESDKDLTIWKERTGGVFDRANIYDLPPIPAYFVPDHNKAAGLVHDIGIDVLVNAGTPRKLGSEILSSVPHGVVNVHPGVLPKYRGCTCVEWAIYNDDPVGNTAHFMTEDYDAGPIIVSEWYEFPTDTTYRDIRIRTYREGFLLIAKAVEAIAQSGMSPADANPQGEGQFWSPIPDDKMAAAQQKIAAGEYRFACL